MAEAKGLMKPVKLKNELAELLGAKELPRTEITKKLWDYIKANKLQTKTENGKAENAGKFIVADDRLLPIFKNTKSKSKSGKVTDFTNLKEGQTINMMQMAAVVGANIELCHGVGPEFETGRPDTPEKMNYWAFSVNLDRGPKVLLF
jgi:chromatin remodeling complex protein RSC6